MFNRGVYYILIDSVGLRREPLLANSSIVDDILKQRGVMKATEVNAFGDIHAIRLGLDLSVVVYLPREFEKYFEPLSPVAVDNVIQFPKKPKPKPAVASVEIDETDIKPEIVKKSWDEIREEIVRIVGNKDRFSVLTARMPLAPDNLLPNVDYIGLLPSRADTRDFGCDYSLIFPKISHLHLEAKAC